MKDSKGQLSTLCLRYSTEIKNHQQMVRRIQQVTIHNDGEFLKSVIDATSDSMPDGLTDDTKSSIQRILQRAEQKKAERYPQIIANQALVMMCTSFDIFLYDCMQTLVMNEKWPLKKLANKNDISIDQIIDMSDDQDILDHLGSKVMKRFDFAGIEDKIKMLAVTGLNMDRIFSRMGYSAKDGKAKMVRLYALRHEVVHKGSQPINNSDGLSVHLELILAFIKSLGTEIASEKGIKTDSQLLAETFQKYVRLKEK